MRVIVVQDAKTEGCFLDASFLTPQMEGDIFLRVGSIKVISIEDQRLPLYEEGPSESTLAFTRTIRVVYVDDVKIAGSD